jgi:hypothetical protein
MDPKTLIQVDFSHQYQLEVWGYILWFVVRRVAAILGMAWACRLPGR